ncbi:MAG: histidine phosphatase family protein [Acidimicrobiia bacterium]|nr:histidine phosphatase family protein [Acidimicrobiia bacterium]
MEITFLRHGRSEANEAGIWQGSRAGGRLSRDGEKQATAVAARIAANPPDLVITSGLNRTNQTAAPLGLPVETDPAWEEMDLGDWDGMTYPEIAELHGDELGDVFAGQDVRIGGTGETVREVRERLSEALESLQARLDDGERALIVTHGGIIETLARMHWKIKAPEAVFASPLNTSLTSFRHVFGQLRLATYNDTGHLGPVNEWARERVDAGDRLVTFVRHGQTDANVQHVVQGRTDWGLNANGREQAAALADWYGVQERVFASPLGRAAQTAAVIAADGVTEMDEFAELSFGSWEGKTFTELQQGGDNSTLADRIFRDGEDLPRGGDGETWAELVERMNSGVEKAIAANRSDHFTVVSHGGAIRAYLLGNMGVGWPEVLDTVVPANTAVTHVVMTSTGPVLADYAVATHLESMQT